MKKLLILIILVLIAGMILFAQSSYSAEKHDLHLIVLSQEPDVDFDVVVDKKRTIENVDIGWSYITYKTADPYEFKCYTYGDKAPLRIDKGRDGDYYTVLFIQKPEESVGE